MRSLILNRLYCQKPLIMQHSKLEMLRNILLHAKANTKYYGDVLPCPPRINSDKEAGSLLAELPILSKDTIRSCEKDLITKANPVGRTFWNTSGGSTGEPILILQDSTYLACSRYITYKQKALTGFKWGMPWVKIWGDEREILHANISPRQLIAGMIKNLHTFNSFRMTDSSKDRILESIERIAPYMIVSYVQSIYELAKFAKSGRGFSGKVDSIIVSAGTLYPFMAETIEEVFKAPVFNRYGSREVGNVAISTPDQSVMAISDGVWLEIIDESGKRVPNGVEGEIVITSLINYAMPLIRYRIGDRGTLGIRLDSGGNPMTVLENVTGRTVDLFRNSDGHQIDGEYFTHLLYFKAWVKKFQFIQKDLDRIVLQVVPSSSPIPSEVDEIEQKIKIVMGEKCKFEFVLVEDIADPPSGKFRFTISELPRL